MLSLTTTGCGIVDAAKEALNKEAITGDEFVQAAEDAGFIVQDYSGRISDDTSNLVSCHVAINEEDSYIIEFYEYDSEESSYDDYCAIKTEIDSRYEKLDLISSVKVNGTNYGRIAYLSSNNYTIVSYIGNTLLYIDIFNSEPSSVKEFLKGIGY